MRFHDVLLCCTTFNDGNQRNIYLIKHDQANMERLCLSFIQKVAMPLKSIMNATRANTTGCVDSLLRSPIQKDS